MTVLVLMAASATGCADGKKSLPPVSSAAVIGHWSGDCGATLDIANHPEAMSRPDQPDRSTKNTTVIANGPIKTNCWSQLVPPALRRPHDPARKA
jgi:hypothetical protein